MALHESVAVPQSADDAATAKQVGSGVPAALGTIAGVGAIAASSCCVVPLTLASLGAGAGTFGALVALVPWRMPLLIASGMGVAAGWFAWWRVRQLACALHSPCAKRPRAKLSLVLLLLASLTVVTAIGWDYLEPALLKLVRAK